ncbi:MAG: 50S ribosomal protein L25 [Polyangiaceae bacterium]|nr:50S ribosomal protein L25 [Polyangiaceae bacterium]
MELRKIEATPRTAAGKGGARRLRAEGKIPAVAYGAELAPESIAVSPRELVEVISSELGRNTPIELAVEGAASRTVLVREYQYHPVSRELLHVDFMQIHLDRAVEVEVPLELTGKPQGIAKGGTLRQVYRKLPVACLPSLIPVKLTHDVTELDLDDTVTTAGLSLPAGVVVRLPPAQTLAAVVSESKRGAEGEGEGEGAPGAPAAAAAPADAKAAAGKAPAGKAPAAAAAKPAAKSDKKK